MRTIKFRAKDSKTGKWVYGLPQQKVDPGPIKKEAEIGYIVSYEPDKMLVSGIDDTCLIWYEIDLKTLGQYVDLNKKREEVYEGDIIAALCDDGSIGAIRGIVRQGKINLGANGFEYEYWVNGFYVESEFGEFMTHEMIKGNIAILGNIHDNPELTEEVEDE